MINSQNICQSFKFFDWAFLLPAMIETWKWNQIIIYYLLKKRRITFQRGKLIQSYIVRVNEYRFGGEWLDKFIWNNQVIKQSCNNSSDLKISSARKTSLFVLVVDEERILKWNQFRTFLNIDFFRSLPTWSMFSEC